MSTRSGMTFGNGDSRVDCDNCGRSFLKRGYEQHYRYCTGNGNGHNGHNGNGGRKRNVVMWFINVLNSIINLDFNVIKWSLWTLKVFTALTLYEFATKSRQLTVPMLLTSAW